MKITALKSFPVAPRLHLVKIEADDGSYGWGEAGPSSWRRQMGLRGVVAHFREFLLGKDPRNIAGLWQEMFRRGDPEGGRLKAAALSAVDIALHDLVARRLGVPVHRLLGGRVRDRVECFTPVADEAVPRWVREGWRALRLTMSEGKEPGTFDPSESIELAVPRMIRVRESVGPGPMLGVDYHHKFTVSEAASFCQKLPPGTLDFIEDPIREHTPGAYRALRRMTQIPFAAGEVFTNKWDWLPFIEQDLINLARIDLGNVGGFTEGMKVAGLCEAHYVDMMPHLAISPISTACIVHFAAAVPNFGWMEDRNRSTDGTFTPHSIEACTRYPEAEGPTYPITDTPGLGVEFDEAALTEFMVQNPYDMAEHPRNRRRDGSLSF